MKKVWLIQLAENLEIDSGARVMRTGLLAQQFEKLGCDIYFFSSLFNHGLKKYRPYSPGMLKLRAHFQIILLRGISYQSNLSLGRVISQSIAAIDFAIRAVSMERPDVIFISYPSPELAAVVALYAQIRSIPYVVDVRDAWPTIFNGYGTPFKKSMMKILGFWYGVLYRFLLKGAKAIYSPSKTMISDAEKYHRKKFPSENVYYLAYPNPTNSVQEIPTQFTAQMPLVVSFVGTFGSSYDVPLLIEVARMLHDEQCDQIIFNIIGDGENKDLWMNQAKGLSNINFCGWLSAKGLAEKLRESHVGAVVYTSGTASFTVPNKLGEYLAFGLTILNSLEGDVPELIKRYELGVTVPSENRVEFVYKWLKLLVQDPSIVQNYRNISVKVFHELFCAENIYPSLCTHVLRITQH